MNYFMFVIVMIILVACVTMFGVVAYREYAEEKYFGTWCDDGEKVLEIFKGEVYFYRSNYIAKYRQIKKNEVELYDKDEKVKVKFSLQNKKLFMVINGKTPVILYREE